MGIKSDEDIICDCSPTTNPGCPLGSHAEGHLVAAQWRVSLKGDPDEFAYLCNNCTAGATGREVLENLDFELLESWRGGR